MAITDLNLLGSGSSKTAATTLAVVNTTGAVIPAGALIVIVGCWDNVSATAPTITCSTIGGATAVANHATPIGSGATATAGAGIFHQCFRAYTTAAIASGATIATLTSNQSAVARAAHAEGWFGVTGTLRGTVATGTSTSGSPSVATTGTALVAGDLVIGTASYENSAQMTADADTLNGTWDSILGTFTTGSTANTNTGTASQDKTVTATGVQTFNPTGGVADSVACVFALIPVAAGPSVSTVTDTFSTLGAQWSVWGGTGVTASGGRLNVLPTTGNTTYRGMDYVSGQTALRGSQVFVELVDAGNRSLVSWEAYPLGLQVSTGTPNSVVEWYVNQTTLGVLIAGSLVFTMTYDPVAHRFLSIRESGGTVYFETSPTAWPGTWVSRFTRLVTALPTYFDIDNSFIEISAGTYSVEAGTTTAMVLDNLNVIPPVVATLNGNVPILTGSITTMNPVVAAVGTTGSSGSPGSIPATPGVPAGVVAGSKVLLVVVTYDSVSGTQHPSDVTVPSGFVNDGWAYSSGLGIGVWWKDATGSDTGTYSVTAATAGALDAQAFLLSFPVATPSGSPFGPHGALATAQISTSSISTGSLTPTANDALLLAFGWSTGGGSTLDVSGGSLTWSVLNNAFNSSSRQHKTFGTALATPAAVAATLTSTGSTDWLGLVYGQIVNAAASNPATLSGKVPVLNGTVVPVFHWDADQSGQPNGTVITQANSVGGTNSVLIASQIQGSPTFANDNPFKDTLSAKAPATTGTKATIGTTWSGSPIAAVRFYVCFPAYVLPTTATQLMQWISNGANFVGLTATGKMYLVAASVTLKTSAASIVADTWYWVSVYSINGTNGTLQWEWHLASDDSLIESYSSSSVNTGTTLSTSFAVGKVSAAGNLSSILIDHVEARIGGNATGLIGPYVQPVNVATLNGKVPVLTGSLPDSSVSVWSGGTPPTGLTAYNDAHPTRIGSTFYLYGGVTGWSTIGMRFYITNELIAGNQIGSDIPVYLYTVPSDGSNPYNGSPLSTATIPFASITVQGWYTAIWPTPVALTNVIPVVVAYQIGSQAYLAATMTGAAITNAPVALSGSTDTNGSYSWVRSYYEYMDILSAGNGTYWTGVDLIVAPVVAGSGGSNNATLNGSVPVLTGSDTGAATNPATLSGKVPVLTGTDTGTATNAATLNGQVPTLTGSATGTAVNAATLNGAVPVLTGSFTAGNISGGTVTGSVPVLTGSIAGTQTNVASLSGSVVALSGSVVGSAVNTGTVGASTPLLTGVTVGAFVVPATLSGAVPVLTGSATGTLTDPASLSGTTPVLTGSASGTVTNPGTLSGKLPSLTGLMLDQTVNVGILNGSTPPLVGGFVGTLSNPVVLNGAVPLLVGSIIDANIVAVNITIDIGPTRSRTQADIALTRGADSAVGATRLGWTADPTRSRAQASVGNTRGGESSVGGTRSRVQADVANTRSSTDIGPTRG